MDEPPFALVCGWRYPLLIIAKGGSFSTVSTLRLYSSTSIACGFLYEEKQETILISCFIILDVIGSMIDFTQGVFFPSIRCFAIFQIDPLRFVPYIQFLEIHIFYEVRY